MVHFWCILHLSVAKTMQVQRTALGEADIMKMFCSWSFVCLGYIVPWSVKEFAEAKCYRNVNLRDMHVLLIFYTDNRQDNWLEKTVKTHACSILTGCKKPNESKIQRFIYHRSSDICQDQNFLQKGFIWKKEKEWESGIFQLKTWRSGLVNSISFNSVCSIINLTQRYCFIFESNDFFESFDAIPLFLFEISWSKKLKFFSDIFFIKNSGINKHLKPNVTSRMWRTNWSMIFFFSILQNASTVVRHQVSPLHIIRHVRKMKQFSKFINSIFWVVE